MKMVLSLSDSHFFVALSLNSFLFILTFDPYISRSQFLSPSILLSICVGARFHGPDKMRAPDWKVIIGFVLPRFSSTEAVSKCQTIPLIQEKLDKISRKQKKSWEVFMEEEMTKACASIPAADVLGDIDKENNEDANPNLCLEGLNPRDDPAVM